MALATIPGYPRIGKRRELKRALEGYWSGKRSAAELEETAPGIRRGNWTPQMAAGLDLVPVNDFSLYDQVLDTCALVGAMPERFGWAGETVDLDLLFAMARGGTGAEAAQAQELTKWFDTNYHYLVPELPPDQTFASPRQTVCRVGRSARGRSPGQASAAGADHLPSAGEMPAAMRLRRWRCWMRSCRSMRRPFSGWRRGGARVDPDRRARAGPRSHAG